MRAALVVVALAGCFNPDAPEGRTCTDWCPPPEQCIARLCRAPDVEPANFMFVTSDTRPINTQTAESLDAWCQLRGNALDPQNTFKAWVSTSSMPARMRFAAFAGHGWVRPDNQPFANTLTDILAGTTFYPPRIDEKGDDIGLLDEAVATGTLGDGNVAENCNDFTPPTGTTMRVGRADAGRTSWTEVGTEACTLSTHVYCLGVNRSVDVAPQLPAGAKRIFLTAAPYPKRPRSDADQVCNAEAGGGTKFAAMVALTTESVQQRFANSTGPWYRPDGVLVTEDMMTLKAPIEVTFDRLHLKAQVWFGALGLSALGAPRRNCNDWVDGTEVRTGDSERSIGAGPFDTNQGNCGASYHYYCAEL